MSQSEFGQWRDMASAPKDGTRVLVELRSSEQGPAEVDVARWGRPERGADECWISADSDPGALIVYADVELLSWMPLPAPLPKLRASQGAAGSQPAAKRAEDEYGGSGI